MTERALADIQKLLQSQQAQITENLAHINAIKQFINADRRVLQGTVGRLNAIESDFSRELSEAWTNQQEFSAYIDAMKAKLGEGEKKAIALAEHIKAMENSRLQELSGILANQQGLLAQIGAIEEKLAEDGNRLAALAETTKAMEASRPQEREALARKLDSFELSVFRAINPTRKNKTTLAMADEPTNASDIAGIDYFDFENRFRGPRDLTKERQTIYLPFLSDKGLVVDLGCGRGEMLELLAEKGIPAVGVDISQEFVDYCCFKGFNAVTGDAIEYISALQDGSVGAMTAIQLAEHLPTGYIMKLCSVAFDKLSDGGYLIVETPNPQCLSIFSGAFYVDPSHIKPIPSMLMSYILEKSSFHDISTIYTEPSYDASGGEPGQAHNSQDYAVIARKQIRVNERRKQ
jgi:O-antigen chain-terminating methyltransferase